MKKMQEQMQRMKEDNAQLRTKLSPAPPPVVSPREKERYSYLTL